MMQTDLHKSNEATTVIGKADGSVETASQQVVAPNDGVVQISVDEIGDIHPEEGFMLVQTQTHVESTVNEEANDSEEELQTEMEEWDPAIVGSTVLGHPSWTLEAMPELASMSLIQTGIHLEK